MDKHLLSTKGVAEALHIGETLAKRLIYSGQIKSMKIGRRRLVAPEDVEAFVNQRRQQADEERDGPPRLPERYWSEFHEPQRRRHSA